MIYSSSIKKMRGFRFYTLSCYLLLFRQCVRLLKSLRRGSVGGFIHDFLRDDSKAEERGGSNRRRDSNISGIPSASHQYPTHGRCVVAGVECVPTPPEIGFEPGAEIHRGRVGGY